MANILNNVNVVNEIGCLNGSFEDVLKYLSYTINERANKNFNAQQKGEEFFKAIESLKNNYGVEVSTHFLKQLCDLDIINKTKSGKVKKNGISKTKHILYMLGISGFLDNTIKPSKYMLNPIKVGFKGFVDLIYGTRSISPKTFDFLVMPSDWESQKVRAESFKLKCLKEWEEYAKMIERESIEADKLKIVSGLEEKPINFDELEEVSPHLFKRDLTLMPKRQAIRGYH